LYQAEKSSPWGVIARSSFRAILHYDPRGLGPRPEGNPRLRNSAGFEPHLCVLAPLGWHDAKSFAEVRQLFLRSSHSRLSLARGSHSEGVNVAHAIST
jgi:hypothetical protein